MTTSDPNASDRPAENSEAAIKESSDAARLFQEAFGGIQHGVLIYNSQLKVLEFNKRSRELLEIPESAFTLGEDFEKIVRLNAERGGYGGVGSVDERVAKRMARARTFEPFHEDQLFFNGRYCEVYGQPIPGGGFVLTYTDITARVHAEQAKNQFLAKISHDIRTPINGLMGMAELLEQSELSDPQRKMVSTMVRSSHVLGRLVDDILDLTRLESGKLTLNDQHFDLRAVLDDVVSTLQIIAAPKNSHIALDIESGFPATVFGDPMRIAQCAINLVGNAIKFSNASPESMARIAITVATHNDTHYLLSVKDTGIGIAEDRLHSLFDPFVQGERLDGKHTEGSGLGLAIVSELVNLMGGEVTVKSAPGKGSTFTLHLPLVVMRSDTAEPPGEMRAVSEPASEPGSHRILVVEDNVDNREVLKMQLNAIGHTADVAVDGEDGLLKWRDGNYALILTDYNMPVMNGVEMTKLIRSEEEGKSPPSIPIIAITGNAIDSELQHCLDAGMNDYLTKPLTLASLKDKIASFLDPAGRDHA